MTFTEAMDDVAKAFEVLGAAVLVLGGWCLSRGGRPAVELVAGGSARDAGACRSSG